MIDAHDKIKKTLQDDAQLLRGRLPTNVNLQPLQEIHFWNDTKGDLKTCINILNFLRFVRLALIDLLRDVHIVKDIYKNEAFRDSLMKFCMLKQLRGKKTPWDMIHCRLNTLDVTVEKYREHFDYSSPGMFSFCTELTNFTCIVLDSLILGEIEPKFDRMINLIQTHVIPILINYARDFEIVNINGSMTYFGNLFPELSKFNKKIENIVNESNTIIRPTYSFSGSSSSFELKEESVVTNVPDSFSVSNTSAVDMLMLKPAQKDKNVDQQSCAHQLARILWGSSDKSTDLAYFMGVSDVSGDIKLIQAVAVACLKHGETNMQQVMSALLTVA